MYTFPSIPGVRDPRLLKRKFKGFREIRIKKRLMFVEEGFDVRNIKHIDLIEKDKVGYEGRDWSEFYWPE